MLISSDANAGQSHARGQHTRFFDDLGCLAADIEARAEGTARFVRLASGGWATTEDAYFAKSADAKTPMDYGIVAFATADEARAADREKQAHRWAEVLTLVEAR